MGKAVGGITATLNTDEVCWNVVYVLRTDILYIDNFSGHQDYEVMSNVRICFSKSQPEISLLIKSCHTYYHCYIHLIRYVRIIPSRSS